MDHLLGVKGYPLLINETGEEFLNEFLNTMKFNPDLGWIRLTSERLTNESDVNATSDCMYLAGEMTYNDEGISNLNLLSL